VDNVAVFQGKNVDLSFNFKINTNFSLLPTTAILDNEIGDFLKSIISLNDAYGVGFPDAKFDANGIDPVNNMGVLKNFVINSDKDITKATDLMFQKFIDQHAIELSPQNTDPNVFASQFKEK
jgi:hypothetical protein